jgi:hypothetical protein
MGSLRTVLLFKLTATEALIAYRGLALVREYVRAMGICGLIYHELPPPAARRVTYPSAHVLPLVLMLAASRRLVTRAAAHAKEAMAGDLSGRALLYRQG